MTEELSRTANGKKSAAPSATCRYEVQMIEKLSTLCPGRLLPFPVYEELLYSVN